MGNQANDQLKAGLFVAGVILILVFVIGFVLGILVGWYAH